VGVDAERRRVVTAPNVPIRVLATNRKASHDFHIHERFEAGIALVGSEVKSLRAAKVTMADGWVEIKKGQAYLHGIQINEYSQANRWQHDVGRVRKLLMHRHEIDKLATKTLIKGYTLIPLQLYFKGSTVKVELGLVTHKKQHDKRQDKRAADARREIDRAISQRTKGKG
jgi:SsrA-binding protein